MDLNKVALFRCYFFFIAILKNIIWKRSAYEKTELVRV